MTEEILVTKPAINSHGQRIGVFRKIKNRRIPTWISVEEAAKTYRVASWLIYHWIKTESDKAFPARNIGKVKKYQVHRQEFGRWVLERSKAHAPRHLGTVTPDFKIDPSIIPSGTRSGAKWYLTLPNPWISVSTASKEFDLSSWKLYEWAKTERSFPCRRLSPSNIQVNRLALGQWLHARSRIDRPASVSMPTASDMIKRFRR